MDRTGTPSRWPRPVPAAGPSRQSRAPPRRGSGARAQQPCAVHAHDHPRASPATIAVAVDGYRPCWIFAGGRPMGCSAPRLDPRRSMVVSADPEVGSRLESRSSASGCRPWRKRFSARPSLLLALRLRRSASCSPPALSLLWRPEESTGSSANRPTGKTSDCSSWRLLGHESGSVDVLAARHESADRQARQRPPQRHERCSRVQAEAELRAERQPRPETPRRRASRDWRTAGSRTRDGGHSHPCPHGYRRRRALVTACVRKRKSDRPDRGT
jgi:hypothetical protein